MSADELAALRGLVRATQACPEIEVGPEIEPGAGVFEMLRQYAARQLESNFRTVRVIEQMYGRTQSV